MSEPTKSAIELLCEEFHAFVKREGLPEEGDAMDLLMGWPLTQAQADWLHGFCDRWDAASAGDSAFYDKQPLAKA